MIKFKTNKQYIFRINFFSSFNWNFKSLEKETVKKKKIKNGHKNMSIKKNRGRTGKEKILRSS